MNCYECPIGKNTIASLRRYEENKEGKEIPDFDPIKIYCSFSGKLVNMKDQCEIPTCDIRNYIIENHDKLKFGNDTINIRDKIIVYNDYESRKEHILDTYEDEIPKPVPVYKVCKRCQRRYEAKKKYQKRKKMLEKHSLMTMWNAGSYNYETHDYDDDGYIKYSGKSNAQRILKKCSNRKVRYSKDTYNNGKYKREFDYWWSLY